jgi:hypothetical protein
MTEPDWDTWRHIPHVARWQAAALSLNINPDELQDRRECDTRRIADQAKRAEFDRRLRIINAQRYDVLGSDPNTRAIGLARFAAWALSIGWDIPRELRALTEPPKRRAADDGEPDPRHRKTLLRIIGALLDLAEIDPDEPPKTTAHSINAKLELRGAGMKDDTIAKVIRDARDQIADD